MGQEISQEDFTPADFERFYQTLETETALLADWFQQDRMDIAPRVLGMEFKAWLVDNNGLPAPQNAALLERLQHPDVVPELARFNIEFNTAPQTATADALSCLHHNMEVAWNQAQQVADDLDLNLLMIGSVPSAKLEDFHIGNMSALRRYAALNEQVMRLRQGRPLHLQIHQGREHLDVLQEDLMLEAAATSLQIHLQIPLSESVQAYNASIILSALMVGISTNSPYLFAHDLWNESRIPLFEKAVEVGGYGGADRGPVRRVSFGSAYARHSLLECFRENLAHYPVLLPLELGTKPEEMAHLSLHNGTIWRWNRPLIGFNNGRPHIRIEHRVMPAGPTLLDVMANVAFFLGMMEIMLQHKQPLAHALPFAQARDNFYAAARQGWDAQVYWLDGKQHHLHQLLLKEALPLARQGLRLLGIAESDRQRYLNIIEQRLSRQQNGAIWQRRFIAKHGRDMHQLTTAYAALQRSGLPVHAWPL